MKLHFTSQAPSSYNPKERIVRINPGEHFRGFPIPAHVALAHETAHAKLKHNPPTTAEEVIESEEEAWDLTQLYLERVGEWTPEVENLSNRILQAWHEVKNRKTRSKRREKWNTTLSNTQLEAST